MRTRVLCLIRRQTSTESTDFRLTSNLPKPPKNSNKISIPRREESSDGTRRVKRPCAACAGFVRLLRGISCRRVGAASQAGSLKGEALRSPAYGQPVRRTGSNEARLRYYKNGAKERPKWKAVAGWAGPIEGLRLQSNVRRRTGVNTVPIVRTDPLYR